MAFGQSGVEHIELYRELERARDAAWSAAKERGELTGRYTPAEGPETDGPYELPLGWTWVTVDQITYDLTYGSSAKSTEDSDGVPVIRMGNIVNGALDLSELKYLPFDHPEFPRLLLRSGDLLFNRTNSPELVGKSAVYEGSTGPMSFASYLIRVRTVGYSSHLLAMYLNSPFGRAWARDNVSQLVGQANINGAKLRRMMVPYPPNGVQGQLHIVQQARLAMERSRRARGAITRVPLDLQAYRRSCLAITQEGHQLFSDAHWPCVELGDLTSTITSGSRGWAKYYADSGASFIRVGNLDHGSVDLDLSQRIFVNAPQDAEAERTRVEAGDMLITITADVGKVAVVPDGLGEAYINQHVALCRPKDHVIPRYLAYALLNPDGFQRQVREIEYGMTKASLSLGQLRSIRVPLPPIDEQQRIVGWLDATLASISSIQSKVEWEAERLLELEKTILAEAFLGRFS